jgi:flagellar assembly factor FliW
VGGSAAESTANLLAPIVLNSRTRQAAQVLQASTELPLRAPLIPAA